MEESKKIRENFELQVKNLYRGDIKFYQIERLITISEISEKESTNCEICKANVEKIKEISENVKDYMSGHPKRRREYENKFDSIVHHLKKEHQYYSKEYFTTIYSFWGLLLGLISGFLISHFILSAWMLESIAIASVFFILILRQIGKIKDKKNSEGNKIA